MEISFTELRTAGGKVARALLFGTGCHDSFFPFLSPTVRETGKAPEGLLIAFSPFFVGGGQLYMIWRMRTAGMDLWQGYAGGRIVDTRLAAGKLVHEY